MTSLINYSLKCHKINKTPLIFVNINNNLSHIFNFIYLQIFYYYLCCQSNEHIFSIKFLIYSPEKNSSAGKNKDDNLAPMIRIRSSSANAASKPISVLQRRQTHAGSKPINFSPSNGKWKLFYILLLYILFYRLYLMDDILFIHKIYFEKIFLSGTHFEQIVNYFLSSAIFFLFGDELKISKRE